MTLIAGSRSARPMAASISSGIGGTMVLSRSGRFSVMVATGPAVVYSSVSKSLVAIGSSGVGLTVLGRGRVDSPADLQIRGGEVGGEGDQGGEYRRREHAVRPEPAGPHRETGDADDRGRPVKPPAGAAVLDEAVACLCRGSQDEDQPGSQQGEFDAFDR